MYQKITCRICKTCAIETQRLFQIIPKVNHVKQEANTHAQMMALSCTIHIRGQNYVIIVWNRVMTFHVLHAFFPLCVLCMSVVVT